MSLQAAVNPHISHCFACSTADTTESPLLPSGEPGRLEILFPRTLQHAVRQMCPDNSRPYTTLWKGLSAFGNRKCCQGSLYLSYRGVYLTAVKHRLQTELFQHGVVILPRGDVVAASVRPREHTTQSTHQGRPLSLGGNSGSSHKKGNTRCTQRQTAQQSRGGELLTKKELCVNIRQMAQCNCLFTVDSAPIHTLYPGGREVNGFTIWLILNLCPVLSVACKVAKVAKRCQQFPLKLMGNVTCFCFFYRNARYFYKPSLRVTCALVMMWQLATVMEARSSN